MSIFPQNHLSYIFIGKVSTMYGFVAGFSSSESILADKNVLFPVLATDLEEREICQFSPQNHLISHLLILNR